MREFFIIWGKRVRDLEFEVEVNLGEMIAKKRENIRKSIFKKISHNRERRVWENILEV